MESPQPILAAMRLLMPSICAVVAFANCCLPAFSARTQDERWLEVQRLSGNVITQINQHRQARIGDRLVAPSHGIMTNSLSSANLAIDLGIGFLAVAQDTQMQVQQLAVLADGSRVTVLDVPQGQVRVQTRSFTHANSRLELHTPSGIAAVRGTEFGVRVLDDGTTNIATLTGQVEAIAQSVTVLVKAGFVSTIFPGKAPSRPTPIDRGLEIDWLSQDRRGNRLYLSGRIDVANVLLIDGDTIQTDRLGRFETLVPFTNRHGRITLTVQNGLGEERSYPLSLWQFPDSDGGGIQGRRLPRGPLLSQVFQRLAIVQEFSTSLSHL